MADQFDQIKKQIDDLNKRVSALGGSFFQDIDQAIASFGGGVKGAQDALKSLRKEMDGLDTDANYFYSSLLKITKELKGQTNYNQDIARSYSKLSSLANKLKYDQDGINELSKKELETIKKKIEIQQTDLTQFLGENKKAEEASEKNRNRLNRLYERYVDLEKQNNGLTAEQERKVNEILKSLSKEEKNLAKIIQSNTELEGLLNEQELSLKDLLGIAEKRLEEEVKINKSLGISGKIVDGIVNSLNKLGISSEFFENLKEDMRDAAKSGSKWQVFSVGIKGIVKGIGEALKDPVTQLTLLLKLANFFVKSALTANAQSVELGKQLGYGADRADEFRERLVGIERSSNNLNVNTKNLVEAFGELVQATGFAYEFTADQLETQVKLTKQVGLQAEEAAQIQRFGVLTGKSSEETYRSFLRGLTAARNQLRVGINFKAVLAEAAKVSGQLAANLGFNPEMIAKAVVAAKAFGMTLDQVAKSGEALLNFESSIENELKAELLTGKQLNLERARAAALAGDQITLAEELAKNIGTAADFTRMNVLQQRSLAESVGMTTDELAETLRRREEALASGKSLAQITEEEAAQALERQNIQDKFNAAIEKLQSLIGNLVAGPLGSFIDLLSGALNIINYMATPLKIIASVFAGIVAYNKTIAFFNEMALVKNRALYVLKGQQLGLEIAANREKKVGELMEKRGLVSRIAYNVYLRGSNILQATGNALGKKNLFTSIGTAVMNAAASVFKSPAGLLGPLAVPIAIAAGAAVGALGYKFLSGDDIMSEGGYGKRTLLAPEGAIRLNDNDTIIAGTNLGGGKGETIMPQIDLTPMIAAINEVKAAVDRLYNKDTSINMDGKKVGSTLVQGSYKVA